MLTISVKISLFRATLDRRKHAMDMIFKTILILNAIWFALGFHAFALRSKIFAKTMVPRELRSSPVFDMLTHTGKFMGGFNLAFCVLNVLILGYADVFPDASQHIILCSTFAVAHGSQFLEDVPALIY